MSAGAVRGDDGLLRCPWGDAPADYRAYHDSEWGRPVRGDAALFERLSLEGFQAGLSWLTILRRREGFRAAFAGFDIHAVAGFGDADIERLVLDPRIIRHRGKIEAAIGNARRAAALRERHGSLAAWIWRFEPDAASRPRHLSAEVLRGLTTSPESTAMSRELKRDGWAFVGPTTMYAFMQSMGLVNDHLEGCCVREAVQAEIDAFVRPR